MTSRSLELSRRQILAYRQRTQALHERLPYGADSLKTASLAGLQDSMPRAALLSIHARLESVAPDAWEDPALAQIWGPRYSAYVVAAGDVPYFTRGRLHESGEARRRAEAVADRLDAFLDGRRMTYREAGHGMGEPPNRLRYAAPTGRVRIRWDGARSPEVWTVPEPTIDPDEARKELARRYLRVFGVGTPESFAKWAGVRPTLARATFTALGEELAEVQTPVGDASVLTSVVPSLAQAGPTATGARLLPSGDNYYLLHGLDRDLLVPDAKQQAALWTSRVWPGALLLNGDIVGTWRRAGGNVSISSWRRLSAGERSVVEAEALSLPLPGDEADIRVGWES